MDGHRFVNRHNLLIIIFLSAMALYSRGLTIPYYSDDFQFVFDNPSSQILRNFTHNNPDNNFYRPLQSAFLAINQHLFGTDTLWIHVIQILLHATLCWLVYLFMKRFGFPLLSCLAAALFMMISQANVHAVLSNDTFSQLAATLFGCASLYFLYMSLYESKVPEDDVFVLRNRGKSVIAMLFFSLALFSKESGIGFIFCILLLVFLRIRRVRPLPRAIYLFMVIAGPFLIITLIYSLIWLSVIPVRLSEGTGTYGMVTGINVARNILFLGLSMVTPGSSVDIFVAKSLSDKAVILSSVVMSSMFVITLLAGIVRAQNKKLIALLVILMLFSLVPVLFLNHVSELYTYSAVPFLSIITGIAITGLIRSPRKKITSVNIAWILILLTIFTINGTSVVKKTEEMRICGETASRLMPHIVDFARKVPPDGNLLLVNRPAEMVEYSVFLINDFNLFRYGDNVIRSRSGRDDITIEIISPPLNSDMLTDGTIALGLSDKGDIVLIAQQ